MSCLSCADRLAEQGHTVVGIECAKQACEEFFAESKLEYTTETVGKFIVFKVNRTKCCGGGGVATGHTVSHDKVYRNL